MAKFRHSHTVRVGAGTATSVRQRETLHSLCRELGPVVYFIRTTEGLIKVGFTTDLAMRKKSYRVDWTDLLAVQRGSIEDERELHERFKAQRARAQEYYHPSAEILEHINGIRAVWGIDPI